MPQLTQDVLSISYIDPAQVHFCISSEGFLDMQYSGQWYRRVVPVRALPFSYPNEYISILENDGETEIGVLRDSKFLPKQDREVLEQQLDFRYFMPEITKIFSIEERVSFLFMKIMTNCGPNEISVTDIAKNFRLINRDQLYITDVEENRFYIPSIAALDKASIQKIEIFI